MEYEEGGGWGGGGGGESNKKCNTIIDEERKIFTFLPSGLFDFEKNIQYE